MSNWTQRTNPRQATKLREVESAFLRLLRPPERLLPSEWAERYRVIQNGRSREPGPWRNKRSPHLKGIMDAAKEQGVQGVVVMKGARIGYSEAWKNVLGYWIDCEPDPAMFVLPDKDSTSKIMHGDIRPLLTETPRLTRYMSPDKSDNTLSLVRLNSMDISTGWAGSAQSLASSNQRRVLFDEIDKFPPFSGRDADPISLGMARANTYAAIGKAFYMLGSTPTTGLGHIAQRAAACTQHRHWHAPCPHCGEMQQIIWSQVKWDKAAEGEDRRDHAARIADTGGAWYECKHCEKRIEEDQKSRMMNRGEWIADDPDTSNRWVAFYAPSYISLMITWSQIAESWIRAQGDPARLMECVNQYLGEPFEEQASTSKPGTFEEKARHSNGPMQCPAWTEAVFTTADVQKDHLWYVTRAWGAGGRSHLVRYGRVSTMEELRATAFAGRFAMADGTAGESDYLAIDARYRREEVYPFAASDPGRILPVVGSSQLMSQPVKQGHLKAYPGVIQRTVNPNYWKDILHGLIHSDDPTQWLPHNEVDIGYCKQMSSEHKIHDRKANTFVWQQISAGNDNHLWDCETMQCMLANECGLFVMDAPSEPQASAPLVEATENPYLDQHKGRWT